MRSPSPISIGIEPKRHPSIFDTLHPLVTGIRSHQVFLQALIVWGLLCIPGNLVTLSLYRRIHSPHNDTEKIVHVHWQNMSTASLCPVLEHSVSCLADLQYQIYPSTSCLEDLGSSNQSQILTDVLCQQSKNISRCLLTVLKFNGPALLEHCQLYPPQKPPFDVNATLLQQNYTCHERVEHFGSWVNAATFWLEGVGIIVVGIFGIVGNLMTVLVLRRIDSNVMFNKLLMSLAIYDALYLLYYVVDHGIIGTFMRSFKEPEPLWYRLTYPYVLWPLKWVFMSCTIFMVVAISAERHRAICSPLTHRPKFWPYVFMVTFSACTFNIPKYFEFKLQFNNDDDEMDYVTTELYEDKTYIVFCSWWNDLIVFGIIPFVSLVFFNLKIYFKVRSSDKMVRFVGRKQASSTRSTDLSTKGFATVRDLSVRRSQRYQRPPNKETPASEIEMLDLTPKTPNSSKALMEIEEPKEENISLQGGVVGHTAAEEVDPLQAARSLSDIQLDKSYREENGRDSPPIHFQKRREKSARVLITIVLTFLFCHTFRFVIKAYEVTHPSHSTAEHHLFCHNQERYHVPVVLYVMLSLHHLLLVVNSSINFIIYCCVGERFRQELKVMLSSLCNWLCQCCNGSSNERMKLSNEAVEAPAAVAQF